MAWIESHEHLEKNGRLLKMADLLGINVYQAIGHLHAFWWWATHNAGRDGDLSGFDPVTISMASGWQSYINERIMDHERRPGDTPKAYAFCHALVTVGFVDMSRELVHDQHEPLGKGAKIHQWEKYSGRYFDWIESLENRRESERLRQRRRRESVRKLSRTDERDSTRPNLTKPNLTKPDQEKDNSKDSGETTSPGSVAAVVLPNGSIPAKKPATPQAEFVEGFKSAYESMTKLPFKFKKEHFIIADRLIKDYGMDMVVEKTKILGFLCRDRSAWFSKGGWANFTIEKLSNQWNSILPSAQQESHAEKDARESAEIREKVRSQREQLNRTMGR